VGGRIVKLLVIVVVLIVLVFGAGGLAVRFVRDEADKALHNAVDTKLPQRVEENPWAPVVHGRAQRGDRIRFDSGTVVTVRCHVALGTYGISIVHGFSFQPGTTPIPHGCPGVLVRRAFGNATKVSESQDSPHPLLTFENASGNTVLRLRGAGS
jgi:hypothetical protein